MRVVSLYGKAGCACLATGRLREFETTRCRDIEDESSMVATRARWRVESCSEAVCSAVKAGTAAKSSYETSGDG